MLTKQRISQTDPKELLAKNPKVNAGTVAAHEALERELNELGVEIRSVFNIEPPLGQNPKRIQSRNGLRSALNLNK